MGEGKSWSGQLLMTVPATKAEVFNFYVKNLMQKLSITIKLQK